MSRFAFAGDGAYPGDGGRELQRLWMLGTWRPLKQCDGRYVSRNEEWSALALRELCERYPSLVCADAGDDASKSRRPVLPNLVDGALLVGHQGHALCLADERTAATARALMMGAKRVGADGERHKLDIGPATGGDGVARFVPRAIWGKIFRFLIFEEGFRDARCAKRRRTS